MQDALSATLATAGRAVFFSAGTVLVGLAGLLAFKFMLLRSLGIAGMAAVGAAVLAAITLLPALLAIFGKHINALRLPVPDRGHDEAHGAWARLAEFVLRHPWRVFIPVLVLLLGLGAPFLTARLSTPDSTHLAGRYALAPSGGSTGYRIRARCRLDHVCRGERARPYY